MNFHLLVLRQNGSAVEDGWGAKAYPSHDQKWGAEMSEYYRPDQLKKFAEIGEGNQELADKFFSYYDSVFQEGALSGREKALIALAVAHAIQCPYCIDAYSTGALQHGSDLDQMTEAIHVACAIRGGASLVHGVQMLEHVKKTGM